VFCCLVRVLQKLRSSFEIGQQSGGVHLVEHRTFSGVGGGVEPVNDKVGYRKKGLFLILPEVFREQVCAGLVADETAKSLETAGFLTTSGSNRLMYSNRVTGNPTPQRFYAVKDSILAA